jgi:hypothetical protein
MEDLDVEEQTDIILCRRLSCVSASAQATNEEEFEKNIVWYHTIRVRMSGSDSIRILVRHAVKAQGRTVPWAVGR